MPTEHPTDTEYHDGEHVPFFVKGSDLFYHKETKEFFLKCEEDWYQVDFTNEKHFALNNNLSITLHNFVTDEVKTLGEMRAWEVVDSDYEPLSDRWFGTPDLDVGYMDTFAGNSTFVNSTPGTGKGHTILDMINATDPSSDEDGSSDEESYEEDESVGGYAQDPNDMTEGSDDEDDSDSDYIPDEDEEEEGEVYEDRFDQEWLNEFYDEKRQDLDGNWYTRRQFYDYYGSDDAWDNLDPNTFQPYRYDEINNVWLSKEEFFQQYSSDRVWDKMTPELCMKRYAIWITYSWSRDLPKHMRHSFVRAMLATY
jgi:hypothetical protein